MNRAAARPIASIAWKVASNAALAGVAGWMALVASGCTPSIGSSCQLSTDCSSAGDRVCDTAEVDGYCTVVGCKPNLCPNEAACTLFNASIPGCMYSDRNPSRLSTAFCMAQCHSDGDCRQDEGYICADPRQTPWQALILDDDQTQKVCIPRPDPGVTVGGDASTVTFDAAVCQTVSPILVSDGTAGDAGDGGAAADATVDATVDAGVADAALD